MSATVPTGLDVETLEMTLEPIDEFAQRELPDSVVIGLDQCDKPPEELVCRMSREPDGQRFDVFGDDPVLAGADALAPIRAAMGS